MPNTEQMNAGLTSHILSLSKAKSIDDTFLSIFLAIDETTRADLITELPETYQKALFSGLSAKKLAKTFNRLRADAVTDMMILPKEVDDAKWLDTIAAYRRGEGCFEVGEFCIRRYLGRLYATLAQDHQDRPSDRQFGDRHDFIG